MKHISDPALSVKDVQIELGICGQNVRDMCETGEIARAFRVPSASGKRFAWRIPSSAVREFKRINGPR